MHWDFEAETARIVKVGCHSGPTGQQTEEKQGKRGQGGGKGGSGRRSTAVGPCICRVGASCTRAWRSRAGQGTFSVQVGWNQDSLSAILYVHSVQLKKM